MKGGKGGSGRSGKPNRGKPSGAGKSSARGGKPGRGTSAGFGGKPGRAQKESFGGRSSLEDAPASAEPSGRGRNPRPRKPAATSSPSSTKPTVANGGAPAPVATDTKGAVVVQRTLNVPASAVIRAINDRDRREWAPQQLYRVVSVLAPRFIRLAFPDGTLVAVSVTRLGNARSAVAVELTKFPDSTDERELRERWAHALAALQDQLDTAWD